MAFRAVHWHEGMFLRPHHMQTANRHALYLANQSEKWDHHYNWGLRAFDLDKDALSNHRLVIRSLQARFRDGTLVSIPEDATLPALDLKQLMATESSLTVHLAVPMLRLGKANVSTDGAADGGGRYVLESQNLEDENTGVNPQHGIMSVATVAASRLASA